MMIFISCGGGGGEEQSSSEAKVALNQSPNGVIDSPIKDMTIVAGDSIVFSGTGNDPDSGLPLTYLWNFGDAGIADSMAEDPGPVKFNIPGMFTVAFTVTDAEGFSDPSAAVRTIRVLNFNDDFSTDTTEGYLISDTWTDGGIGQFLYDTEGDQVHVLTGNDIGLQFAQTMVTLKSGFFSVEFLPIEKYPNGGRITIRLLENGNNFYEVHNTDGYGAGIIRKFINGQPVENVSFTSEYIQNTLYQIQIYLADGAVMVNAFNNHLLINSDAAAIQVNRFEVELSQQDAYFDNILVASDPFIRITTPQDYHIQNNANLMVQALTGNLKADQGIKFAIDVGTDDQKILLDYASPFGVTFTNVTKKEHTLDAFIVDDKNHEVSGEKTHDQKIQIGIGDYYVAFGDSITEGNNDDVPWDDISQDLRNTGGGYPPILNDRLTDSIGYPHTVVNEGVGGEESIEGLARIQSVIHDHPNAQYFLILFGTNDSHGTLPVPSGWLTSENRLLTLGESGYNGSFLDNMQQIIDKILTAGKEPMLAKVPITLGPCSTCTPFTDPDTASRNLLIQEYNLVIEGLVSNNGIAVTPPDFYEYFRLHQDEMADNLHPNGIGFQSMAGLWFNALTS